VVFNLVEDASEQVPKSASFQTLSHGENNTQSFSNRQDEAPYHSLVLGLGVPHRDCEQKPIQKRFASQYLRLL